MLRTTEPEVGRGVHPWAKETSSSTAEVALGPLNADEITETERNATAKAKLRCNVIFAEYMVARIRNRGVDTEIPETTGMSMESFYDSTSSVLRVSTEVQT